MMNTAGRPQQAAGTHPKSGGDNRIMWIDMLRGFLMFLVIYGHNSVNEGILQTIYAFHMPAFFVISGMTFCFNKETRILPYIKKKVIALLVPYVLLNLYVSGFWYLGAKFGDYDSQPFWHIFPGILISQGNTGWHMPSNTTWFITCLFLVDIMFFLIWKICKEEWLITLVTIMITATALAAGMIDFGRDGAGYWHWKTAIVALVFYLGGWLFLRHRKAIEKRIFAKKKASNILIGVLFAEGFFLNLRDGRVSMIAAFNIDSMLFYLSAFSTTFALVLLFMKLSRKKRFLRVMKPVDFIGKETLPYIALHVPLMRLVRFIPFFASEAEPVRLLLAVGMFFGLMPVAWLMKNYMLPGAPWLKARKNRRRAIRSSAAAVQRNYA